VWWHRSVKNSEKQLSGSTALNPVGQSALAMGCGSSPHTDFQCWDPSYSVGQWKIFSEDRSFGAGLVEQPVQIVARFAITI